jgi:hypothetical protein
MNLAVVSESPADESAIRILVDAISKRTNKAVASGRIRPGGWSGVLQAIEVELKSLHYRGEADALVTVVDSDDSPIHEESHEISGQPVLECRVCQILERVRRARASLRQIAGRKPGHVVVGLAVPAIEAWLLYGTDPHIVEARYERDLTAGVDLKSARIQLKQKLYGTANPSRPKMMEVMQREATRLTSNLAALEAAFPKGFGRFARQIRSW